ncbi:immunity 26/phosphotriesterase HocA family protein [Fusobacterium canifelinum]|uniref:Immunity 26/phosphotriesterase HocA family protein n=1 Tax=Fusobacterium canifelinum TaxID=285729 RepID=A0A7T4FMC9_9FUSO|nr:immunity 26/phosphotriesterase HocA family protein [Fusobacterium canifelinum]QQB73159.1 immunity 26/phosphotriesterase HocA family protein [Fusobacterium canifelinum]
MKLKFELTNEQRKYLGLIPVEKDWKLVRFEGAKYNEVYYYFDGNIIRKEIIISENSYYEAELNEKTAENCTMILPKTSKGKIKKFNFTATQSFSPFGTYFSFSNDGVLIANYTTQKTYYYEDFKESEKVSIEDLKKWLDKWIKESTKKDLKEIEEFKNAKKKHCKFKEGDFFAFKIGRREWGFGRILLDISKLKKDETFKKNKNYGLNHLMGKPLIIKIYHKISNDLNINLKELSQCLALPSQAIMDNIFYYGEAVILGNLPLESFEYDMLISLSNSINGNDENIAYLQYGLIYKEIPLSDYKKLIKKLGIEEQTCRKEGIGFGIYLDNLRECIKQNSNNPYWKRENNYKIFDLRNPFHIELKRKIFKAFGLDGDKNYEENLKSIAK